MPPPPPQVTVIQPVHQRVSDYLEFTGNTQAFNTVQLVARRDVARIELSRQSYSNFSVASGHKAAAMPVFNLPGVNALDVADELRGAMAAKSKEFPSGLSYEIRYDTTKFVQSAIHEVCKTLFEVGILVIAATAIISAINKLTFKPAQCPLWLRPIPKRKINWFFRGFNKSYAVVENSYMRLVTWMVAPAGLMVILFVPVIVITGWRFANHPTGFLHTEDSGLRHRRNKTL